MIAYDALTDAELLARTVSGDSAAFGAFYRRYERPLLGWLRRRTDDPEIAADVAAETFAKVLDAADRFDRERAGGDVAAGWLFTIASNTLIASVGRRRVAEEARRRLGMSEPLVFHDEELDRVAALSDEPDRVRELLAELPEEQRVAVEARVLDEREYDEIADELECSSLVVRKRVSRGLASLRLKLKES